MNSTLTKYTTFLLILLTASAFCQSADANHTISGNWQTTGVDENRLSGSLIIKKQKADITISYTFVFDRMRINTNLEQQDVLKPIDSQCFILKTRGDFFIEKGKKNEFILCLRDNHLVWSSLIVHTGENVYPTWVRFTRKKK